MINASIDGKTPFEDANETSYAFSIPVISLGQSSHEIHSCNKLAKEEKNVNGSKGNRRFSPDKKKANPMRVNRMRMRM